MGEKTVDDGRCPEAMGFKILFATQTPNGSSTTQHNTAQQQLSFKFQSSGKATKLILLSPACKGGGPIRSRTTEHLCQSHRLPFPCIMVPPHPSTHYSHRDKRCSTLPLTHQFRPGTPCCCRWGWRMAEHQLFNVAFSERHTIRPASVLRDALAHVHLSGNADNRHPGDARWVRRGQRRGGASGNAVSRHPGDAQREEGGGAGGGGGRGAGVAMP